MTAPLPPDALVPSAPVRPTPTTGWLKWTLRRRLGRAKTCAAMAAWTAPAEHTAGPGQAAAPSPERAAASIPDDFGLHTKAI